MAGQSKVNGLAGNQITREQCEMSLISSNSHCRNTTDMRRKMRNDAGEPASDEVAVSEISSERRNDNNLPAVTPHNDADDVESGTDNKQDKWKQITIPLLGKPDRGEERPPYHQTTDKTSHDKAMINQARHDNDDKQAINKTRQANRQSNDRNQKAPTNWRVVQHETTAHVTDDEMDLCVSGREELMPKSTNTDNLHVERASARTNVPEREPHGKEPAHESLQPTREDKQRSEEPRYRMRPGQRNN